MEESKNQFITLVKKYKSAVKLMSTDEQMRLNIISMSCLKNVTTDEHLEELIEEGTNGPLISMTGYTIMTMYAIKAHAGQFSVPTRDRYLNFYWKTTFMLEFLYDFDAPNLLCH